MPKVTEEAKNRDQALLAEIHADRQLKEQDLGWLFRPLAVCPFPAGTQGKREIIDKGKRTEEYRILWTRRAGNIKVEVLAHPDFGIPHGQDTLIILFLAYEASRQGSRKIKVNFYRDFMRMFEMNANDGRKYRLVIQSLQRIRNSKYSWEVEGEPGREKGLHFLYIDEYDLYCDPKSPDQKPLFDQYILLSERFWQEIITHKIPSNLKPIIALKSKPAHLNFYIWLSYRVWCAWNEQPGEAIPIPFFGPRGLQEQMSSVIEEKRNFRIQVKNWLKSVKGIWPRCPVEIKEDALYIYVTKEDQLDVQPKDTDAPRILPAPKPLALPEALKSACPKCGKERTLERGRINQQKDFRYPDFWKCSGSCPVVSADAICKQCGSVMEQTNKGRQDYSYKCQCGHTESGENYWIQNSMFLKADDSGDRKN